MTKVKNTMYKTKTGKTRKTKNKSRTKIKKRGGAELDDICRLCLRSNDKTSIIACKNGHKFHNTCICDNLMYTDLCECGAQIFRNIVNICESKSNLNNSIVHFKNNWMCSKGSNCHHTSYAISKLLQHAKYTMKEFITDRIMIGSQDLMPFFNKHYLLHVHAPSHHFYIEIVNKEFRLISLWDSLHGIHNYYLTGPYGKLNNLSDIFIENIDKLCSGNNQSIKEALEHLFDKTEKYTDYSNKTVTFDVFELIYT